MGGKVAGDAETPISPSILALLGAISTDSVLLYSRSRFLPEHDSLRGEMIWLAKKFKSINRG